MNAVLIDTPNQGYARTYLRVDIRNKEVCLVKGKRGYETFCGLVEEGNNIFNILPPFWQDYCRIAWRKMSEK